MYSLNVIYASAAYNHISTGASIASLRTLEVRRIMNVQPIQSTHGSYHARQILFNLLQCLCLLQKLDLYLFLLNPRGRYLPAQLLHVLLCLEGS